MGPDMDDKTKIIAFDGKGFHNWKFRMETVLDMHDLLDCLQREVMDIAELQVGDSDTAAVSAEKQKKTTERKVQEKKCKSLIVQAISDNQLELIKDCQTPKQIWDKLKNVFERRGVSGQLFLRKQLLTLKYVDGVGSDMSDHLLRFDKIIRELKGSGATVEEADAVCHLLVTLPSSFDSVVTAIETLPGDITMDFVKKRLLDVDMKRRNSDAVDGACGGDGVAMASKHGRKKLKCFQCGKLGHRKAECPDVCVQPKVNHQNNPKTKRDVNRQKANVGAEEEKPEIAFMTAEDDDYVRVGWFLDSGATEHMLCDPSYFSSMRKLDPPVEIVVANGQRLSAEYCGDVTMYSMVNDTVRKCEAKNVLYLPRLSCNLFSVKRIAKSGLRVCFDGEKAEITKNSDVVAVGQLKGKLYELNIFCKQSEMGSAMITGKVSRNAVLWHQRYGHIGCDSLRELVRFDMVKGLTLTDFDKDTIVCEPCLSGKIGKLPFAPVEERRSSRPLELIHSDVCGPITPRTWDGKRFVVTFTDDFSHFTVIYLMATKDEVIDRFREYEALVTAHFGARIAKLRTDNGGEYVNDEMRAFCRGKGIVMQLTVPYTPQQNGVAERLNRTLMERARALLAESGFGKEMWGEATYTATYITNRCPTSAVQENKTPYELWNGRKPDVAKLRIFGSTAYLHVPKELRSKLDPKCKKFYLVGYTVNGYRLWDMAKKKIVVGRDVVFDEKTLFNCDEPTVKKSVPKMVELVADDAVTKNAVNPEDEALSSETDSDTDQEQHQQPTATRRSNRVRRRPTRFDGYEMAETAMCAENFVEDIPNSVEELRKRSDWPEWQAAISDEMNSLVKNKTWTLTSLPPGKNLIDSKWIFKVKHNDAGGIVRFKARLVARGFSQRKGFDYESTYAPVAGLTTLRVLLAIANQDGMNLHQLDVKTAFLNGFLEEEIYMRLPVEFEAGDLVAKLQKSIYGLKQASRAWNSRFHDFVLTLGFRRSEIDNCLYTATISGELVYLLIYVDDILIASHSLNVIIKLKAKLKAEFEMTDMDEVNTFLGLTIVRRKDEGVMEISQRRYLERLLDRFGMADCKPKQTPLETNMKLEKCTDPSGYTTKPYRELIGCLTYVAVTSRPDICAAVNYYSTFQSCASDVHWNHAKRILRYIKGTLDLKLVMKRSTSCEVIEGYADSDWAGDIGDRKSLSGYVFQVHQATVSWTAQKQRTVALSSAEAEYISLSVAVKEAIWLRMLLKDFKKEFGGPTIIHEDNQACISVAEDDKMTKRLKHIDVRYRFVQDAVQRGTICLEYVASENQVADIMTKGLPRVQFEKLRSLLGVSA